MVLYVKELQNNSFLKSLGIISCQVALTEKWAEIYKNKGIGFYSMHPGWADTPGVATSMPGFSKS